MQGKKATNVLLPVSVSARLDSISYAVQRRTGHAPGRAGILTAVATALTSSGADLTDVNAAVLRLFAKQNQGGSL